jgi:hypothetical protein
MKALLVLIYVIVLFSIIPAIWWLFYFLWNTIAADIFGAPTLTFWQSVGLLILIGIVTSGFRAVTKSS